MHTTESSHYETLRFHHNGDYSGKVKVVFNTAEIPIYIQTGIGGSEYAEIEIEFDALRDLVLEMLRSKEVSHLENMSYDELVTYYTG